MASMKTRGRLKEKHRKHIPHRSDFRREAAFVDRGSSNPGPTPISPRDHRETGAMTPRSLTMTCQTSISNEPLSEQYRLAALEWVDADGAASLLEETKSATFSQMVGKILDENPKIAVNRAETLVKSSDEYKEFVSKMVLMRTKANRLKVQMEFLRMRFMEQNSREASARAEMRL